MEKHNDDISMKDMMGEIERSMKRLKEGDIVKGKVISVTNDEVLVNIGYMSDGIIPRNEVSNEEINLKEIIKPDDEIYVSIIKLNDGEGNVLLSKKSADVIRSWDNLEQKFKNRDIFNIKTKEVVKGGIIGYISGIRCFIPASQLSMNYVEDLNLYNNKELEVKLIEFDKHKGKVVASAKEVQMKKREKQKQELLNSLQKGEKRTGKVVRLAKFGAFVELGGVQGLIHLSDLSWKRVNDPSEVVSVGDTVEVYILDFDKEKERISLGLKDIKSDPWNEVLNKLKAGDIVQGTVVKFMDFGAFVEVLDGIEGLVHISEISDDRVLKPSDVLKIGDTVKVKVLEISSENKRISLSIKSASTNMEEDLEKYNDKSEGFTLADVFKDKLKDWNK
ncbi:small subunit ribosomal protein S1 [Clostridium pascui]|uniref:30S ribosomal protein S1 n=1 Tax=Clostridium pascui TaxID=46609 RepID=UPI0019561034|nr:30S ribosomal protein S1 [Clostridium pascui]MBM7869180.1 small subunit ribosomal protein S1 [Clostridium pascui]